MSDIKVSASPGYTPEQAQQAQKPPGEPAGKDAQTIHEMIKESREKAARHKEQLEKIKTKPRYGDAPLEAYARLARAKTQAQAGMAAGYARRRIAQLRGALQSDSDNAEEIKAALRQLQKAVSRAGKKKMDIQKEEIQESRRKRLLKEQERQRAQQLSQELRQAKMMRAFRENGYMHEAVVDNHQQAMLSATRAQLREQSQALTNAFAAKASSYAAQQYTAVEASTTPEAEAAALPTVDVKG